MEKKKTFSDECSFSLRRGGRVFVWRKSGERDQPKNAIPRSSNRFSIILLIDDFAFSFPEQHEPTHSETIKFFKMTAAHPPCPSCCSMVRGKRVWQRGVATIEPGFESHREYLCLNKISNESKDHQSGKFGNF